MKGPEVYLNISYRLHFLDLVCALYLIFSCVCSVFNDSIWNSEQIGSSDYVMNSKAGGRGLI